MTLSLHHALSLLIDVRLSLARVVLHEAESVPLIIITIDLCAPVHYLCGAPAVQTGAAVCMGWGHQMAEHASYVKHPNPMVERLWRVSVRRQLHVSELRPSSDSLHPHLARPSCASLLGCEMLLLWGLARQKVSAPHPLRGQSIEPATNCGRCHNTQHPRSQTVTP